MKDLLPQTGNPGQLKERIESRQVIKQTQYFGQLKLEKGQRIYEMVIVPDIAGQPVKGTDPETGAFDPELAEIREARFKEEAAVFGVPVVTGLGPVKPGTKKKLVIVDGNIYEVAINRETARRKMIKKYFPTL